MKVRRKHDPTIAKGNLQLGTPAHPNSHRAATQATPAFDRLPLRPAQPGEQADGFGIRADVARSLVAPLVLHAEHVRQGAEVVGDFGRELY